MSLGNVPTKELNPNTPITTEEILNDIEKGEALGASVVYISLRDDNGKPTSSREKFREVLEALIGVVRC